MITTNYGVFNGGTWEDLCQKVFKRRYGDAGYQEMHASPGDYGIEGFVSDTGVAFQCYCPEKNYTQKELHEKIRSKINEDLNKLKNYVGPIRERLSDKKIKKWIFVTPYFHQNEILKYTKTKAVEVRGWGLDIIDKDFDVLIYDADFFSSEIHQIKIEAGEKVTFIGVEENDAGYDKEVYENNVSRKNKIRCERDGILDERKHARTNERTIRKWLDGESFLKEIEERSPDIHFKIKRVIHQYEEEVEEMSDFWSGEAENLILKVRDQLGVRISEAVPELGEAERYRIADHMTSKWLAMCPLEIE